MALINLDYLDAMLRVQQMENAARQCDNADSIAKKILGSGYPSNAASGDFMGDYYQAFYTKVQEWAEQNRRIGEELRATAKMVKETAEQIKAADEAAARAAK